MKQQVTLRCMIRSQQARYNVFMGITPKAQFTPLDYNITAKICVQQV